MQRLFFFFTLLTKVNKFVPSYIERVFRIFIEMFFVIISISIYNFGIYLILVLSNCNAIQSTNCHVRYFNKLSIYLSIYPKHVLIFMYNYVKVKFATSDLVSYYLIHVIFFFQFIPCTYVIFFLLCALLALELLYI